MLGMSTRPNTSRYLLVPEFPDAEGSPSVSPCGQPVRRFRLARLHFAGRAEHADRYAYLKRTHD